MIFVLATTMKAFLEPRVATGIPFDLSETSPAPSTEGRSAGARFYSGPGAAEASPEHLAILTAKLARMLVQSGRDVALNVSKTPLLGALKG